MELVDNCWVAYQRASEVLHVAKIVKLPGPLGEISAIEQSFDVKREEWNEYKLRDGGSVRIKVVVQKILRILDADGKPAYTAEGDPNLIVRHSVELVTSD
jgi:hypothetical protein